MGVLPKESSIKLKEVLPQGKRSMCSHSLMESLQPRWPHSVKEQVEAAWPPSLLRGNGQVLYSKCPAYTQPTLPKPWIKCSVPKRHMTKCCISLITRAGISSLLYVKWRWMVPEHITFSLIQTLVSFKPSEYGYRCERLGWRTVQVQNGNL